MFVSWTFTKWTITVKTVNPSYWILIWWSRNPLYRENGQYKDERWDVVPLTTARKNWFTVLSNTAYEKRLKNEYALYIDESTADEL